MSIERPPIGPTPSQTVGPFFAYALTPRAYGFPELATSRLAGDDTPGEKIRVEGYVLDGDGEPIVDAMLELWQADTEGRYAEPGRNSTFTGFGRTEVDSNGFYSFETVKPGRVVGPDGQETRHAPHANIGIFARGLLRRLFTRVYFEDEVLNDDDAILNLVPAERRSTLLAPRTTRGQDVVYTFNIRLQGDGETVFFAD